jgi:hypothetical protein
MPTTDLAPAEWQLLNAINMTTHRNAELLLMAQIGTRDDLLQLWSHKLISAAMPLTGTLDLAQHLAAAGARLNLVNVALTHKGHQVIGTPSNRVLRQMFVRLAGHHLAVEDLIDATGTDLSVLADLVERGLITARYRPTGAQPVPAEALRSHAIPTAHVTVELTARGRRHLPLT